MKKFASAFIAVMIAVSMVMCGVVTTSAAGEKIDYSQKGSIVLTKQDPSNAGVAVKGATFTAYKVMALNDDGTYTVQTPYKNIVSVDDLTVSATSEGGVTFGSTSAVMNKIPNLQAIALQNAGIESAETTDGTYTMGNLDLGVYLVVETGVPAGYVATTQSFLASVPYWGEAKDASGNNTTETKQWNYTVNAKPKDVGISVDKKVTSNDSHADVNAIGDTVGFSVTSVIPNYGMSTSDPLKTLTSTLSDTDFNGIVYKMTDKLSKGFSLQYATAKNVDTIKVVVDGKTLQKVDADHTALRTRATVADDTVADYKVTTATDNTTGVTTMTLEFAWATLDALQGKPMTLTYDATLNKNATIATANTNDIALEFDNDPTIPGALDRLDSHDDIYSYEMDLTKTFNGTTTVPADFANVQFVLKDADGHAVNVINDTNANGTYTVFTAATEADTTAVDRTSTLKLGDTGKLIVKGLKDGTYTLEETSTANGFSKLDSAITIIVEKTTNDGVVESGVVASNYQLVNDASTKTRLNTVEGNDNAFAMTINNVSSQFNLPLTGGLGLWLFTIGGGIVMAGAIIFISVVRKNKKKNG